MNRFALPIVVFVLLLIALGVGLTRDPTRLPSPFIDKAAPVVELRGLKNQDAVLNNDTFAGRQVLINFWATWCVGCREEHGFLMRLADSGVIPIYGINWRDSRPEALQWLAQLGDPYVMSGFDGENRTGIDWGVYGAPETFLIGADGVVQYKHLGALTEQAWQTEFVPRLEGAAR